jgi:hypothetical protein
MKPITPSRRKARRSRGGCRVRHLDGNPRRHRDGAGQAAAVRYHPPGQEWPASSSWQEECLCKAREKGDLLNIEKSERANRRDREAQVRKVYLTILGFITAIGMAIIPVAAQASTPAASATHPPTTTRTYYFHASLPAAQCAALRVSSHNPKAGCALPAVLHLKRVQSSDGDTYLIGSIEACAQIYSNYSCNTNYWWTKDNFGVTYNGTDAWNNVHTCYANSTSYTDCTDYNNGTPYLEEGYYYGGPSGDSYVLYMEFNGDGPSVFGGTTPKPDQAKYCIASWSPTCAGGTSGG